MQSLPTKEMKRESFSVPPIQFVLYDWYSMEWGESKYPTIVPLNTFLRRFRFPSMDMRDTRIIAVVTAKRKSLPSSSLLGGLIREFSTVNRKEYNFTYKSNVEKFIKNNTNVGDQKEEG